MPTSPLTAPLIPPGSIDTPNAIISTLGPRLVTPTVTVPVAGNGCGGVLAQAPAPTKRAAESERRTQAPADGFRVSITASSPLRAYQGRPLGLDRLGIGATSNVR